MIIIEGKQNGFCYGVKRAVDGALKLSDCYCLGELVHNKQVVDKLSYNNIRIIESLEDTEDNSTVIVRAHGISKDIYCEANKRNINLIDYTCPFVKRIHDICTEFRDKKYYIFVVGIRNHPETIGNISYCGSNYSLIESLEDIDKALKDYSISGLEKSMIVFQTTYNTVTAKEIIRRIKNKVNNLVIKNTICLSTENRQKEASKLSKKVDMMIIVGGKNSSNTKKLYDISSINCSNVLSVETKDDLNFTDFNNVNSIGIISGASTPKEIVDEIIDFINNIVL